MGTHIATFGEYRITQHEQGFYNKLTTSTVEKVLVSVSSFKVHLPLELHSEISVLPYYMSSKPSSSPASSASSISLLTNSS